MKLLWEDIYKYGLRDEIEFLLEALSAQGEFASVFGQFKEKIVKNPELTTTYKEELEAIKNAIKSGTYSAWVRSPEAKEIINKFKKEIMGNINQGAFAGAVTEVDPVLIKK